MAILSFQEFLNEMPHYKLASGGDDKFVDLELETHSKMSPDDFYEYINDWVSRQTNQK